MMNPPKFTPRPIRREKTNLSSGSDSERNNKEKDPVDVVCRLRTLRDEGEDACIKLLSSTVLSLTCPTDSKVLRSEMQYSFKHIFTSYASQKEVFDYVAMPMLVDLVNGKNGLLFTYGVTGSGKTYTLTGEPNNPGIMPRCIDTLFNSIGDYQANKFVIKSDRMNGFEVQTEQDAEDERRAEQRQNARTLKRVKSTEKVVYTNDGIIIPDVNTTNLYAVFISYIEIYNNIVFDLLDESSGRTLQSKILREDSQKNMYVNGVCEKEVKSAAEAFELFNAGQRRKRMGHTILNSESSRSHSIFNIRVAQLAQVQLNSQGERMIPEKNLLKIAQLSLVDLAGSERSNRTQNKGARLKEASCINNSLMTLRSCLDILRDNQLNNANKLVPYRDSRLTLLFKNYFEGEGKVKMIVCVNPSNLDYEENLQVMKFAEVTQDVKVVRPESRYTPYRKNKPKTIIDTPISKIKTRAPVVFGPKLECIKANLEDLDQYLESARSFKAIIKVRRQKSAILEKDISAKVQLFRKRWTEKNDSTTLREAELKSKQQQLIKERKKNQNLELKVLDLEKSIDVQRAKNRELDEVIITLRHNLDEKDLKLNHNLLKRERERQKFQEHEEKREQELDIKLRKQREHLNAVIQANDMKLAKVRQVLETDDPSEYKIPSTPSTVERENRNPHFEHPNIPHTPQSHSKLSQTRRLPGSSVPRRRSRSVGAELWLEHNSIKPVALGTVMQPAIKKRKSVTKLTKASDVTNSKQSKYCLIAQEPDVGGEVETKVYKADIVPTCGGGAQVIFNDVECLRQESPCGTP